MDISQDLVTRSDQLNADDLLGGQILVHVQGAARRGDDGRVIVRLAGRLPWAPCKTMLRLLVHAWGPETDAWVGRWLLLYRDPKVTFGGDEVGGIRVRAMSHIARPLRLALNASKGKKALWTVEPLAVSVGDLRTAISDAMKLRRWTKDQVAALLGVAKADDVPEADRPRIVAALAGDPPVVEAS